MKAKVDIDGPLAPYLETAAKACFEFSEQHYPPGHGPRIPWENMPEKTKQWYRDQVKQTFKAR